MPQIAPVTLLKLSSDLRLISFNAVTKARQNSLACGNGGRINLSHADGIHISQEVWLFVCSIIVDFCLISDG